MEKIKRTTKLPSIQLDNGMNYSKVAEKIKFLAENYDFEIHTEEQFFEDVKMWKVKATLTIHEDERSLKYTGTATEKIGANEVNLTSALENCETSAVGRACAFAGIGIQDEIASLDEMEGLERKREVIIDDKLEIAKLGSKKAEKDVLGKLKNNTK